MRDIKNVEDFMKKKAKEEGRAEGRADMVKAMSSRGGLPRRLVSILGTRWIRFMICYLRARSPRCGYSSLRFKKKRH